MQQGQSAPIVVKLTKKIGNSEYEFSTQIATISQFIEFASALEEIPSVSESGGTNVKPKFRTTKDGHSYYSIVDGDTGREFELGQLKNATGLANLFPKAWKDPYVPQNNMQNNTQQAASPFNSVQAGSPPAQDFGTGMSYQATPQTPPTQQAAPASPFNTPTQAPVANPPQTAQAVPTTPTQAPATTDNNQQSAEVMDATRAALEQCGIKMP